MGISFIGHNNETRQCEHCKDLVTADSVLSTALTPVHVQRFALKEQKPVSKENERMIVV